MSKHLSEHPEFIKAFVYECFNNGFNEKSASELLNAYAKAEFYTTDEDYREGFDSAIKEANVPKAVLDLIKALGSSAKGNAGISAPIIAGAAGGALAPAGVLPENFEGGAMSGATIGALLGALGTRGRGLGASVNRIGQAISKGGLGRTTLGEAGKLITNKSILKGTGKGVLGGLAAVGANNLMNESRFPKVNPNTGMPWYMNEGGVAGAQSSAPTISDPFDLPSDIMARVQSNRSGDRGISSAVGPVAELTNKKNELVSLDNTISQMQNSLPSGANPTSFSQRQSMQAEIDNLKIRRHLLTKNVGSLENQINQDKSNMFNLASERQRAAEQGLSSSKNEFDMLRRRQQIQEQGGVMGGLMGLYNRMTGIDNRMQQLDPMYSGYQQQMEQARRMQELAQ